MQNLKGKTAVVTGAASGIGLAMAELFSHEGMNVVLADVERNALDRTVTRLQADGRRVIGVVTDVADSDSVQALADAAWQAFDKVHLLCNNAGVFVGGATWESSEADYRWVLDVNVMGVAHGIRHFVPRMIASGEEGHIVNTASMSALTTMPFSTVYSLSKAAVLSLSECLYKELQVAAPQIGVSVLCPEGINTGIADAERNRQARYARPGDQSETDFSRLTLDALKQTTTTGLEPRVMAERVLRGVRERKFYLLAEDFWRDLALLRMDEIRAGTNPTLAVGGH